MSKKVHGSYYEGGRSSRTFLTGPHRDVGFRLAHDSPDRVNRGGCCYYTAQGARVAGRDWGDPGDCSDYLGFRLVRDEEGK